MLSNQIQHGFATQRQTVEVFFDLEKAYDITCRSGILKASYDLDINGKIIRFLKEFLSDRYFKVKVGGVFF